MLQLCQLASASRLPSMQHSQRLDQRLHMLRDEVRTMVSAQVVRRVWVSVGDLHHLHKLCQLNV